MLASRVEPEFRTRVLLVDDDDGVRNSIYALLESAGYEIQTTSNGAEGLATYNRWIYPVNLLVTDYNMPRMSGLELARECARLDPELGVLYVSGSEPDHERQEDLPNVASWRSRFMEPTCFTKSESCCSSIRSKAVHTRETVLILKLDALTWTKKRQRCSGALGRTEETNDGAAKRKNRESADTSKTFDRQTLRRSDARSSFDGRGRLRTLGGTRKTIPSEREKICRRCCGAVDCSRRGVQ